MLKDFPVSQRPLWRLMVQEALAYTASGLLFPFGLRGSQQTTARKSDLRTLVVVHGYLANRSAFMPLTAYLRYRGIKPIFAFNYDSSAGVERAAHQLREYLRRHVRGGRIDLVCHSLGGLVARVYLQDLGGHRRVDRCVTLATPHHGTYNSYWLPAAVGRQLRPDSPLISRLEATSQDSVGVRFLSVIAGSDTIVIPRIFASHEQTIHLADLGHISMLFSPRVFRLVASFLLDSSVVLADEG